MTHTIFRRRLQRLIPGVIATVLIGIAVAVFLRSIGDLLTLLGPVFGLGDKDVDTYSAIFNQLKAASLNLPLMLTGVLCLPLGALSARILHGPAAAPSQPTRKAGRIVAVVVLWVILALPLFAVTLWFTEVNDVRFGRVLLVLVNALLAGAL